MDAAVKIARALLFLLTGASGIVSLYSAINAMAVSTNLSILVGGIAVLLIAGCAGPLFCFMAAYGFVRYFDRPVWEAVMLTAPIFIAWSFMAIRVVAGLVAPRRAAPPA